VIVNLPPALTFLQLFSSHTACVCDEAAPPQPWLADMLMKHASNGTADAPRVLVSQGKPFEKMVELPKWGGIIAINCPGVTAKRLEAAGFTYARAFAVLPSLQNARWFVPLDSGAMAAAGFSLYTPARRSAHWKKRLVRLAARLRVPMWYRDTVVIASRQPPPLEAKLAEIFPNELIRVALSSGAPEPAINRKASTVVLGPGGRVMGFVKVSGTDLSRRILEHEATILPALADRATVAAFVPKLLFAGEVDERYVTVQSPLPGNAAAARLTPAHRQFLSQLRSAQIKPASATQMVAALPAKIAALSPARPELAASLEAVMPTLHALQVPSTIVHGDFAPWNLHVHAGRIAAFDWEYGQLDGLPLVDETHYVIQLGFQLENWTVDEAYRGLTEIALARPLGLQPPQVRAIHMVYLLDSLARLLGEGYDAQDEFILWYRKLLEKLTPAPAPAPKPTNEEAALV
jgi:hypothetical protein